MADEKDKPINAMNDAIENRSERLTTRRGFIKSAIISGVAIAATATAAKKVGDKLLKMDYERLSEADERRAREFFKGKKLVLMTRAEKDEMVRGFEAAGK
jgi:hypothetical protein